MKNFFSAAFLTGALLCGIRRRSLKDAPSAQTPQALRRHSPTRNLPLTRRRNLLHRNLSRQPNPLPRPPRRIQGAAGQHRIAPGSVIPVQLTKTIDAKKAKPGDEVVAKVTMDLKTNGGEVMIPKDTKVMGRVTEAQARSKEQKESQVGIAFDRAVLKDGEMPLPMSIQAVIAPPSNNANNGGGVDQSAIAGRRDHAPLQRWAAGNARLAPGRPSPRLSHRDWHPRRTVLP